MPALIMENLMGMFVASGYVTREQLMDGARGPFRRGDASAGVYRCDCGGTITHAREERTGLLHAACDRCDFRVEG